MPYVRTQVPPDRFDFFFLMYKNYNFIREISIMMEYFFFNDLIIEIGAFMFTNM